MPTLRCALLCFLFLAAVSANAAAPSLTGRWEGTESPNEFLTVGFSVSFHPDGRYASRVLMGDTPSDDTGTFKVQGDSIIFTSVSGETVRYGMKRSGDSLTLTGGILQALMLSKATLRKVPGSEKSVVAEAKAADDQKAREDNAWKQRIPLGRIHKGANAPVGEVPRDGNWKHVFDGATVFAKGATYTRWNINQRWTLRDRAAPNGGYSGINWHFHGNGRVFFHSVLYLGGGGAGTAVNVDEKKFWGRYRVEDGSRVIVDMDSGEKMELVLLDGHRNLRWGKNVYGHLEWETQQLRGR